MPQPRRKTAIRTVSGTAQDAFRERLRALRDDPALVLPLPVGEEHPAVRRIRSRLGRVGAGRASLLDRLDRGIVGAVAKSRPLAERTEFTHLLDAKVGGQRRFYLQVGHVERSCSLGVQNHDHAPTLLMAWRTLAKKKGLHVFASRDTLWCSGATPSPPAEWFAALSEKSGVALAAEAPPDWGCGHADRPRVVLGFRGGPSIRVCGPCGQKAKSLHRHLREYYAGPQVRLPVEVAIQLPDATPGALGREAVARYRGGLDDESVLLRGAVEAWRQAPGGVRFVVGDTEYAGQAAFLEALQAEPWERLALSAMTKGGHAGRDAGVGAILEAHRDSLAGGIAAILGPDGPAFLRGHAGMAPRALLRAAHDEARRREATAHLPAVRAGPLGAWVDSLRRTAQADGRLEALRVLRREFDGRTVGRSHLYAFLHALGGDLSLESRFQADERHAAESLMEAARRVLGATGDAYVAALGDYLAVSGSGERAERA